jgi:hypothetical protein
MQGMYTYNPLTSPNSIRLLEVQLKGDDYGKIQTCLLNNAPEEFLALSYTWGCPYSDPNYELEDSAETSAWNIQYTADRTIPITIDGATLMVSRNCKDAIDNIKQRYNSRNFHIWIDAVCINQDDLDERAAQVSIMGQIYSKAFRVIIWLGNSLHKTNRALELIDALSQISEEQLALMKQHTLSLSKTYGIGTTSIRLSDWQVLGSFLGRTWFERVWTLQEYALPRHTIVLCGTNRIPWLNVWKVSNMFQATGWYHVLHNLEPHAHPDTRETPMQSNYALKGSIWLHVFTMTNLRALLWPDEVENDIRTPLIVRIQPLKSRSATDNRDKVYGVLDAINRIFEKRPDIGSIIPNYRASNTVSAVFTDLSYRTILFDQNLLVLSFIHDEAFRAVHKLPSWALDLSRVGYPSTLIRYPPSENSNSIRLPTFLYLEHQYKLPIIINQFSLCVQGIPVDHIIDHADEFRSVNGDQVSRWLKLATQLNNPYHSHEGPTEVLWRTLISNTAGANYPAPSSLGELFQVYLIALLLIGPNLRDACKGSAKWLQKSKDSLTLMESLKSTDPQGCFLNRDEFSKLIQSILETRSGADPKEIVVNILDRGLKFEPFIAEYSLVRCLFLTKKKYLGLGAKSLQHGDEIWVLPRTQAPMILRRLPNGRHMVVGQAYVHGIMYGETDIDRFGNLEDIILL